MKFKRERREISLGEKVHAHLRAQDMGGRKQLGIDDVVGDFESWRNSLRLARHRSHGKNQAQEACPEQPRATIADKPPKR